MVFGQWEGRTNTEAAQKRLPASVRLVTDRQARGYTQRKLLATVSTAMIWLLTALVMTAFAANSLLCRLALAGDQVIDPVSFTSLRLLAGAIALSLLAALSSRPALSSGRQAPSTLTPSRGSWLSGLALFAYALGFSLAYLSLSTGMGALILFGAVQVTMIGCAVFKREPMHARQWLGTACAAGGLIALLSPGLTAPDPVGAIMMAVAGIAWGVYSIRGKRADTPVLMTAGNFRYATCLTLAASACVFAYAPDVTGMGVLWAVCSGALTSGLGYALWYYVLPQLRTAQASTVQLSVPIIAAFLGIVLLNEPLTWRLSLCSVVILGGVLLAIRQKPAATSQPSPGR